MISNAPLTVALVDDHIILRESFAAIVNALKKYTVIFQADDGQQLIEAIQGGLRPDIVMLDQEMPRVDGLAASRWLYLHHPGIKVLMFTMYDAEYMLIQLICNGVTGFLKKDAGPSELPRALDAVARSEFYYPEYIPAQVIRLIHNHQLYDERVRRFNLTDEELAYIRMLVSELSFAKIARRLQFSPAKAEYFREVVYKKLGVTTRVGVVVIAIRCGLVKW